MEGLKGKKILVTGGAGFIGSHLVKKLASLNAQPVVVDFALAERSYFVKKKLYLLSEFIVGDIRNTQSLKELFLKYKFDYVFHLAAQTIVTQAYQHPYDTFTSNIMGTVNILEEARKSKHLKRIIVASSDKAYGKSEEIYTEETPLQGDHPYDVSKSSADIISRTYFITYGLPVVIVRSSNVYGEGDLHFDRIVPGICESLCKKKVLKIRSNGKYIRDYLYIEDLVDGLITLLVEKDSVNGQAYNLTSKDAFSVLDLVQEAEKVIGKKIKLKILNSAKNEIPYQHLSDAKIKKLGWEANTSFVNVFPRVYKWYEDFWSA